MRSFNPVREFMQSKKHTLHEITYFQSLFQRYSEDRETKIDWDTIESPKDKSIVNYNDIATCDSSEAKELLSKLIVCKLNGGLGTSMGCAGPKSAIEVRDGKSFLDLIVAQVETLNSTYNVNVPLLLMNSFINEKETNKIIKKYNSSINIQTFQQNKFPRLSKDTLTPLSVKTFGDDAFYPPGHGDVFDCLHSQGLLDDLIKQGKEYIFIANADNLGASVDLNILKLISDSKAPYIMEVTDKTRADIKGGTLICTERNPLELLEFAQVPSEHREEFKSIKKFKIFNTNNIWLNIAKLKKKIEDKGLDLDLIINKKTVNQYPVIQLETAIGSAIKSFKESIAIRVPRMRFLPVKKTNDLLLVQSNLFVEENGLLKLNPARQFSELPLIRLGEQFSTVDEYQKRFTEIPDLLELDLLTIVGNVYFGKKITLKGNVILVCDGEVLHIPDCSQLENKVLTGNIQIGEL